MLPLAFGDAPARERILLERLEAASSARFFPRCIQNFRISAPSSVSVRSNAGDPLELSVEVGRPAAAVDAIENGTANTTS